MRSLGASTSVDAFVGPIAQAAEAVSDVAASALLAWLRKSGHMSLIPSGMGAHRLMRAARLAPSHGTPRASFWALLMAAMLNWTPSCWPVS